MSALEIKEVLAEIGKRVGAMDGVVVVYPHQLADGAVVAFKHNKLDVVIATARIWFRNKVEFHSERAYIPIVFGELSFGQARTNIVTEAPPPIPESSPQTPAESE